jgi:hypothetical protein
MSERATIRPVTLARLVELANACDDGARTTEDLEMALDISHRRGRETILEAVRVDLLTEREFAEEEDREPEYATTQVGEKFLESVQNEAWSRASSILETHSPHYGAFLDSVDDLEPTDPDTVLDHLEADHEHAPYDFNQTSIDVIGDWGERLGAIQRNAFTGSYYRPSTSEAQANFGFVLLSTFDDLEETTGVNLSQRYLSIPELREHVCERLRCTRPAFDEALLELTSQNVGKLELSGAPMDTGAKEAKLGIKQISLADSDGLVSTDQSTDRVMAGVEQFGKQYYYLAVHDDDLTFTQESNS